MPKISKKFIKFGSNDQKSIIPQVHLNVNLKFKNCSNYLIKHIIKQ